MIGVAANATDLKIAEEFFELFKTPWEPLVPGRKYRVALSTDGRVENLDAEVLLVYGSAEQNADTQARMAVEQMNGPVDIEWGGPSFPIYGHVAVFETGTDAGAMTAGGRPLDYRNSSRQGVVWRIGYDLFWETRYLLTKGQPTRYAQTPTLELHIAVLRHLLLKSAVPFVEVPSRPLGYDFTCCLTHDVDFIGIRRHRLDRTLAGFIARASVGTLVDSIRGRRPVAEAVRNWIALCSLPLVFLRLAPDFWRPFEDYPRVEKGRRSTFFVIPFKGRPGVGPDNTVNATRAVRYQASEIPDDLNGAAALGSELAVHGIDAWRDADAGRAEMAQLTGLTGQHRAGVRMHWLYFAEDSPQRLESAGFDYDSTWGYNDTIGYRPGTPQVFRIPGTRNLMELPLTVMDSAMFFRGRMALRRDEALRLCRRIVANARRFGGALVINWHDRSLAPERLWGQCYEALLEEVAKGDRAWFVTAGEAVDWFRWRRSIRFRVETSGRVTVVAAPRNSVLAAARLCIHRPLRNRDASVEELSFVGDRSLTLEL